MADKIVNKMAWTPAVTIGTTVMPLSSDWSEVTGLVQFGDMYTNASFYVARYGLIHPDEDQIIIGPNANSIRLEARIKIVRNTNPSIQLLNATLNGVDKTSVAVFKIAYR